jgi:hypothetical protein
VKPPNVSVSGWIALRTGPARALHQEYRVNKFKQWLIDVGLWRVQSVEEWSWDPRCARPFFWRTATNRTHRVYRGLISDLVLRHVTELKEAYEQGARDGALQYAEFLQQEEEDRPPEERYYH